MNFDFQAGKTPLDSRQNPVIYLVILIAIAVIAVFFVFWIINRIKKNKEDTPEFKENEKKRPTKLKDIKNLSKHHFFTKEDMEILWYICKNNEIPNIFYSINKMEQFDYFNSYFAQAYNDFKKNGYTDKANNLFKLKFKLDKIYSSSITYSSTYVIPLNTKFYMITKNGSKYSGVYIENAKDYFAVKLDKKIEEIDEMPQPLDKIAFTFSSESGMPYTIVTRLIRFQKRNDETLLIIAHTKELITRNQRNYKRIILSENSRFSSVKTEVSKNGKTAFIISDNKYQCVLTNLSGGGCCITTSLPIKEGQTICTEIDFYDGTDYTIGRIVKTRKTSKIGVYNLHIQFIQISLETQNKILAKVYGYD